MKKNKNIGFNAKLVVICFILAVILYAGLLILEHAIITEDDTNNVYVALNDVSPDTYITEDNFGEYFILNERAVRTLPAGYITDKNNLINHTVREYLAAGNVATDGILKSREAMVSDIKDGVIISFSVQNATKAVGGRIRPGNRVNVWTVNDTSNNRLKSEESVPIAKNLYIIDTFDSSGVRIPVNDETSIATMFTVMIPSEIEDAFYEEIFSNEVIISKIEDIKAHELVEIYSNGKLIYQGKTTQNDNENENTVNGSGDNNSDIDDKSDVFSATDQ